MLKKNFVRGLLFLTPIGVTILVLLSIFEWVQSKIESVELQGLYLALIIALTFIGITLLGFLGSTYLLKPIGEQLEKLILKIPFVSLIYSSIKDLSSAFMGDKKKFDVPVLVQMNEGATLRKPGFITRKSLRELGNADFIGVYFPHSYNFSGNLYVTEEKYVEPLKEINSGEFMKFIVSGGVTGELK